MLGHEGGTLLLQQLNLQTALAVCRANFHVRKETTQQMSVSLFTVQGYQLQWTISDQLMVHAVGKIIFIKFQGNYVYAAKYVMY